MPPRASLLPEAYISWNTKREKKEPRETQVNSTERTNGGIGEGEGEEEDDLVIHLTVKGWQWWQCGGGKTALLIVLAVLALHSRMTSISQPDSVA